MCIICGQFSKCYYVGYVSDDADMLQQTWDGGTKLRELYMAFHLGPLNARLCISVGHFWDPYRGVQSGG